MYFPNSGNEFIKDVVESLRKRHKALKHRVNAIACERIIERDDHADHEKIEITFRAHVAGRRCGLRVFVWDDRWLWVDCRLAGKRGWLWEWTREGRLRGPASGRAIMESLERTLDLAHTMNAAETARFDDVWIPILARGPRLVH